MLHEEYRLRRAYKEIKEVCDQEKIAIDAKIIYKCYMENAKTKRRGLYEKGISAASLYFSYIKNKENRAIEEIASDFNLRKIYLTKGIISFLEIYKTVDAIINIECV